MDRHLVYMLYLVLSAEILALRSSNASFEAIQNKVSDQTNHHRGCCRLVRGSGTILFVHWLQVMQISRDWQLVTASYCVPDTKAGSSRCKARPRPIRLQFMLSSEPRTFLLRLKYFQINSSLPVGCNLLFLQAFIQSTRRCSNCIELSP